MRDRLRRRAVASRSSATTIFVTNPKFIARGIKEKTANAALIKLNQIGTVTETVQAIALCRKAGWGYVTSHRSGETEDTFLADFTVAMGGGHQDGFGELE